MAGMMQWFQVTCPSCAAHLQVRLPEGITSVQCSECKAVFAVQIQPTALAPQARPSVPPTQAQPSSGKRSRKRKAEKDANAPPRALSAYNVFMKAEVAKVKAEHPELPHREAFKMAAERWQASPMNPQNGGERFPALPKEEPTAANAGGHVEVPAYHAATINNGHMPAAEDPNQSLIDLPPEAHHQPIKQQPAAKAARSRH